MSCNIGGVKKDMRKNLESVANCKKQFFYQKVTET